MFDRYEHRSHSVMGRSSAVITVNERKAPTDDSVRLLAEMQEAARQSVIDAYPLEGNLISGVVDEYADTVNHSHCLRAIFEINGRRMEARASTPFYKMKAQGKVELWVQLRDEVAKTIATELVMDMSNSR